MTAYQYLDIEWVLAAHEVLLRRYWGLEGGGHRGSAFEGVEAAVLAVENSYYDDVYELAAAYAVYIVQGHVFLDGNKRAASAAMLEFLRLNGKRPRISTPGLVSTMLKLQSMFEDGASAGTLIAWVASRLRGAKVV